MIEQPGTLIIIFEVIFSCIFAMICLGCVGICFKIYSEMMKEHTIRKRYETQAEEKDREYKKGR